MNVKKAIKRIAALAAGTTMVTATIMGAMAYDLSDYPAPFVEDGMFGGKLVIGQTAKVSDVLGAIDIAASLQAVAVSPVDVDGSETVSVSGGVQIKSGSSDYNYGEALDDFEGGEYDEDDFDELLAEGTVAGDDDDYDYEQSITLPTAEVAYGMDDDYSDDPVYYVDFDSGDDVVFHVDFSDPLDLDDLTESNTIEMFGIEYTFDAGHVSGTSTELTLYGSDATVTVSPGESVDVQVDGEDYTIEVLGGNSDNSDAIIRVTGDKTETETMVAGESDDVAGLDIYVDDVFISNIGEDTISVSLFVGSNEIIIPIDTSAQELEINDEEDTDLYGYAVEDGNNDITDIYFTVDPTKFDNPAIDDKSWNWLVEGESWTDSLFGFSIAFEGHSPMPDSVAMLERNGDTYELSFTNNDGDDYEEIELFVGDGSTTVAEDDNLVITGNTLAIDDVFIVEESETNPATESVSFVFEVKDIDYDSGAINDSTVTLTPMDGSQQIDLDNFDEIGDTGYYVSVTGANAVELLDAAVPSGSANDVKDYVYAEGGLMIGLADTAVADGMQILISEDADDEDETTAGTLNISIVGDADEDIGMASMDAWSTGVEDDDEAKNYRYSVSEYGSMAVQEIDNNGDSLELFYTEDEVDFNIFLNGPDAVVVRTGTSDSTAYTMNDLVVGQIAVYDSEAASMLGSTPLIVVGGPCVNTVAMGLMDNPEVCWEGFTEGKAKIVFFDEQNAILVAGHSGEDTTGAAQYLAKVGYGMKTLSGSEVEVITTDLKNLEVNVVA